MNLTTCGNTEKSFLVALLEEQQVAIAGQGVIPPGDNSLRPLDHRPQKSFASAVPFHTFTTAKFL